MKKICASAILLTLALTFTGCSREQDNLFDKSAAERLNEISSIYSQRLTSSKGGWVMEYYPDADNEDALFFRAYIYTASRRYKEARADYKHLLKLNPMHEDGRLGLAILCSKDGRPREAQEQIESLIQFYPTHARHYLTRCGMYEQRREYEKAIKDVNTAIELEPQNPDCYLTRASLYLTMKKKGLANQDCRTAISLGASADQVASLLSQLRKSK